MGMVIVATSQIYVSGAQKSTQEMLVPVIITRLWFLPRESPVDMN